MVVHWFVDTRLLKRVRLTVESVLWRCLFHVGVAVDASIVDVIVIVSDVVNMMLLLHFLPITAIILWMVVVVIVNGLDMNAGRRWLLLLVAMGTMVAMWLLLLLMNCAKTCPYIPVIIDLPFCSL